MAAVPLFGDTNMATVTSRENTQYIKLSVYNYEYLITLVQLFIRITLDNRITFFPINSELLFYPFSFSLKMANYLLP